MAEVLTDFPERFSERKELHLLTTEGERRPARLLAHWFPTGKNADKIVLQFDGVDSITAAETLSRSEVVIPDSERATLGDGEFYVSDLIGCMLVDEEHTLGTIRDVHFTTDTHGKRVEEAAPLLVVDRPNGDELLVPLAKEFLQKPDIANKRIEMRLPKGLLDING